MANNKEAISWSDSVAITTAILAVLIAIASLHVGTNTSLMLVEKNNANLYQNQANKEWNTYLAQEITSLHQNTSTANINAQLQAQADLQMRTNDLEKKVTDATNKAQMYFEKNNDLANSGIFFEIAIAISAISVLIKRRYFWLFSLLIAGVGVYFLTLGFI